MGPAANMPVTSAMRKPILALLASRVIIRFSAHGWLLDQALLAMHSLAFERLRIELVDVNSEDNQEIIDEMFI